MEVLIGTGILAIVTVGTLSLMRNSFFLQRNVSQNSDFDNLSTLMAQNLSDPVACKLALNNQIFTPSSVGQPLPIPTTTVNMGLGATQTPLCTTTNCTTSGMTFGLIKVTGVTLTSLNNTPVPGMANYTYQAILTINAVKSASGQSGPVGGPTLTKSFPLDVQLTTPSAGTAGSIVNCFSGENAASLGQDFCSLLKGAHWSGGVCTLTSVFTCTTPKLYAQAINTTLVGGQPTPTCVDLNCYATSPQAVFHGLDATGKAVCTVTKKCTPNSNVNGTICYSSATAAQLACNSPSAGAVDSCGAPCTPSCCNWTGWNLMAPGGSSGLGWWAYCLNNNILYSGYAQGYLDLIAGIYATYPTYPPTPPLRGGNFNCASIYGGYGGCGNIGGSLSPGNTFCCPDTTWELLPLSFVNDCHGCCNGSGGIQRWTCVPLQAPAVPTCAYPPGDPHCS